MLYKLLILTVVGATNGLRMPGVAMPSAQVAMSGRMPAVFMGIEEKAQICLEEECSLATVEDLIAELKDEAKKLTSEGSSKRQVEVLLMLGRLQALKAVGAKSEIEKIVAGMTRSFETVEDYEFPGEPLGYTGTPNKAKVGLDK